MRGADYFIKRVAFAIVTVFVAITINFALFRLAPGSAVTNLARVPHATPQLHEELKRQFGLDKSKWRAVRDLPEAARAREPRGLVREPAARLDATSGPRSRTRSRWSSLGTVVLDRLRHADGRPRRLAPRHGADERSVTTALAFYAMPTHWLGLMLVILFAGVLPDRRDVATTS